MSEKLIRRDMIKAAAAAAAALVLPRTLFATLQDTDESRLVEWVTALRAESAFAGQSTTGARAVRAGELAIGTPYEAFTLEAYLREGGSPLRTEPLALALTRFDCVTLVESALAVARLAASTQTPTWQRFGREVERMRYRGGRRRTYTSRLHYFSEWIADGERRGLVRDLGAELGGVIDSRPLRFMSEHRGSYPALENDAVFREISAMEWRLDSQRTYIIPTARIAGASDGIESGDILAFATSTPGLDVSHAAFAYRDRRKVLRVLHAPLSGGAVEITRSTLPEYVEGIRRSTGILVARPLRG